MRPKRDLYEELGVDKGAHPDTIKKAFRRRVRKAHPDAGGDTEECRAVVLAYEVLGDPGRRRRYDETGSTGEERGDLTEEQLQARAESVLAELLVEAIERALDAATEDPVAVVRSSINNQKKAIAESIRRNGLRAKKLRTGLERLTRKDGRPTLSAGLIRAKLEAGEASTKSLELEGKLGDRMLAELDKMQYRVDRDGQPFGMPASMYQYDPNMVIPRSPGTQASGPFPPGLTFADMAEMLKEIHRSP